MNPEMNATSGGGAEQPPWLAPIVPMLLQQTRAEFLKLWRVPAFSIFSLAFPLVFYLFFGLPNAGYTVTGTGVHYGAYLLVSFGAYGAVSVMLFSFGLAVANERGQRMHVLLRATPLRPMVDLLARIITALAFALAMLVLLYLFGIAAGGVRLPAGTWINVTLTLLLGATPFIAAGFAIGYAVSPNAAPAVVNLTYIPLSFASGLLVPLSQLPSFIRAIAPYLPTYHYAQLAWNAVGVPAANLQASILWIVGYGVGFIVLALLAYRREANLQFS